MSSLKGVGSRILHVGLIAAIALCAFSLPSVAEDEEEGRAVSRPPPSSWYASTFISGRVGYRIIHYWSKGSKMRAETLISGHPVATIVLGDRYIAVDRLTRKGIEIKRSPAAIKEDKGRARPFGNDFTEIVTSGAEKIEETTLFGLDVEVWRVTNEKGRQKVWVSKNDMRIPMRIETFDRESSETVTVDYSNWTFDLEMAKTFFEPADDMKLERYSYDDYVAKAMKGPVGSVPVLYPDLLHGSRPR